MGLMHYEVFIRPQGTVDEMKCKVCGSTCEVERGRIGATGLASAMCNQKVKHDHFKCSHIGEGWHEQALGVAQEIENCHSPSLKKAMKKDLEKIIRGKKILE